MKATAFVIMLVLCVSTWTSSRADERTWGDTALPEQLAIYDVNGDGVLSVEEIQAMENAQATRHEDWAKAWDTNHDGVIDEGERDDAREALRGRIEATRTNRFNEADSDGDGCLTFEEFSAIPAVIELAKDHPEKPAEIYARLDANDDNCVSLEEFTARLRHNREFPWRTVAAYKAADIDTNLCLTFEEFSTISNVVRIAAGNPDKPAQLYRELDRNHDDCLSLEEFLAPIHFEDHPIEWRTVATYRAADVDSNGCLTVREFAEIREVKHMTEGNPDKILEFYNRLDVNHDGCLTVEEFTAPPPPPLRPLLSGGRWRPIGRQTSIPMAV